MILRKSCQEIRLKWSEALPFVLIRIRNIPSRRHGLIPFAIVFGFPLPTGITKPSIVGSSEHYGKLSEQFDAMTMHKS